MNRVVLLVQMHPQRLDRQLEQLKDVVAVQRQHTVRLVPGVLCQDGQDVLERTFGTLAREMELSANGCSKGC